MEDALLDARDQLTRLDHRPVRIFLLRHGQSVAAVDESLQEDVPDTELPLSPAGVEQAEEAGIRLRYALGSEGFIVWSSPFKRAMDTAHHMLKATRIPEESWPSVRTDVRLREQDCGAFEEKKRALSISEQKKRRWEFGAWYYRFESGENGAEVYARVESFIGSLHRHYQRRVEGPLTEQEGAPRNVVIIAHGVGGGPALVCWCVLSEAGVAFVRALAAHIVPTLPPPLRHRLPGLQPPRPSRAPSRAARARPAPTPCRRARPSPWPHRRQPGEIKLAYLLDACLLSVLETKSERPLLKLGSVISSRVHGREVGKFLC